MKSVAVLMVSAVAIVLIVQYCLLPPRRMPDYVLGDGRCDICGEGATYKLTAGGHYLAGEYCNTHRWMGVINSDPLRKVMQALLGASVFGVVYSVFSLLTRTKEREPSGNVTGDQLT